MKTLEQIQEENRKAIIMANNPSAKNYDEALEMEIEYGCKIYDLTHTFFGITDLIEIGITDLIEMTLISGDFKRDNVGSFLHYRGAPTIKVGFKYLLNKNEYKIIGKPLTLDRVLIAASKVSLTYYPHSNGLNLNSHIIWELLAMWNLTKPTLEDQSEKTQRVINKLFII
jgi:hypothetical protein